MSVQDCCVIVPTIRDFGCLRAYLANARQHGFELSRLHVILITEDSCEKQKMEAMLSEEGVSGEVFNQSDRTRWFQDMGVKGYANLIPRRSHAETSFGLLVMWANPQFAYGWFLDDDTSPVHGQDFFGAHMSNLRYLGPMNFVSSDKRWVNVLYQSFGRHGLYPRGYPYAAIGEHWRIRRGSVREVVLSQGLWINVPDLDTIRILAGGDLSGRSMVRTTESDFGDSFVVETRNYLTISSMNLAFRREVIPAFYQFPMDDNRWKIGRFDDIWSGVLLKRVCDLLGKSIITGLPLCVHDKAPRNVFRDLSLEVPALELNEHIWEIVDSVESSKNEYEQICLEVARAFRAVQAPWTNADFLPFIARYIERWIDCLHAIEEQS